MSKPQTTEHDRFLKAYTTTSKRRVSRHGNSYTIARIKKLFKAGTSRKQIAEQLGVGKQIVTKHTVDLIPSAKPKAFQQDLIAAYVLLTEHGLTKREAAQAIGRPYKSFLTLYARYTSSIIEQLPAWKAANTVRREKIQAQLNRWNYYGGLSTVSLANTRQWERIVDPKQRQERNRAGMKNNPHFTASGEAVQVTCPWCSKQGASIPMRRFHFDRCKQKPFLAAAE